MYNKTIKLFLMDGEADGRIKCEISNSNLIAFKIPKIKLKDCKDRSDINYSGVYILIGEKNDKECIYIGQSDKLYKRMVQHLTDKDYWNECILFTRTDNSFNTGNILYLEDFLYNLAKENNRVEIDTQRTNNISLTENEVAEMEEVIDIIKIFTNVLGFKYFEKIKEKSEVLNEELLYINSIGLHAEGIQTEEGFVVFKDSQSNDVFKEASNDTLRKKWKELREQGIIVNNVFVRDTMFGSPSTAAAMVLGRNANGLTEWKNKEKVPLKKIIDI